MKKIITKDDVDNVTIIINQNNQLSTPSVESLDNYIYSFDGNTVTVFAHIGEHHPYSIVALGHLMDADRHTLRGDETWICPEWFLRASPNFPRNDIWFITDKPAQRLVEPQDGKPPLLDEIFGRSGNSSGSKIKFFLRNEKHAQNLDLGRLRIETIDMDQTREQYAVFALQEGKTLLIDGVAYPLNETPQLIEIMAHKGVLSLYVYWRMDDIYGYPKIEVEIDPISIPVSTYLRYEEPARSFSADL